MSETIESFYKRDAGDAFSQHIGIKDWQKSTSEIYVQTEVGPLVEDLAPKSHDQIRLVLILNPGLLQDDIAKNLDIHPFSMERCNEKPEDVELEDAHYSALASTALGKVILQRREARIANKQKEIEESRIDYLLDPYEIKLLSQLHRPDQETAKKQNVSVDCIREHSDKIKSKLGVGSRIELILFGLENGIEYSVPRPPALTGFTIREREVSARLVNRNPQIAEELNLSVKQTKTAISGLLKKTGAINRTELALIAKIYNFKPSAEELMMLENSVHPALKPFTQTQRQVILLIHLPVKQIAVHINKKPDTIFSLLQAAQKILDIPNKREFATHLHEHGLRFGIIKPEKPIHEMLSITELEIVRLCHMSTSEIAQYLDITREKADTVLSNAKGKLGARSRNELIFMIREFDTGEAKHQDTRTRIEIFADTIGLPNLSEDEAKLLLGRATNRQAECISAYYFSDISWTEAGKQLSIVREAAYRTAKNGLRRIRTSLEEDKPTE